MTSVTNAVRWVSVFVSTLLIFAAVGCGDTVPDEELSTLRVVYGAEIFVEASLPAQDGLRVETFGQVLPDGTGELRTRVGDSSNETRNEFTSTFDAVAEGLRPGDQTYDLQIVNLPEGTIVTLTITLVWSVGELTSAIQAGYTSVIGNVIASVAKEQLPLSNRSTTVVAQIRNIGTPMTSVSGSVFPAEVDPDNTAARTLTFETDGTTNTVDYVDEEVWTESYTPPVYANHIFIMQINAVDGAAVPAPPYGSFVFVFPDEAARESVALNDSSFISGVTITLIPSGADTIVKVEGLRNFDEVAVFPLGDPSVWAWGLVPGDPEVLNLTLTGVTTDEVLVAIYAPRPLVGTDYAAIIPYIAP